MYPEYEYFYYPMEERQLGQFFPPFGGGPMGPPPGVPGTSPYTPGQGGPPSAPPPSAVPMQTQQAGTFAVDPGSIRGCLFRYTYVWLNNGRQFWFYPTFVGRRSVSGWRWNGFRWLYFGIDLRQISSFTCF
ncbi:hypothetical protein [Bacillus suaedaesalsae]|uniref:Transporter n=1 Tax=Bacillus suaedaesalsae TaxID=2810349 RepID=A0ABS2DHF5_9BACI|nr:hypothetical protein [Bacillus suaedaesalsae]MBM6617897.1 hypothetical protein [Bacillus suaedaesalsae]